MADADSCLFCKIVRGDIPANKVHQADGVTAFRDIAPQAPTHILVIPDQHVSGAAAMTPAHDQIVGRLVRVAAELARQEHDSWVARWLRNEFRKPE